MRGRKSLIILMLFATMISCKKVDPVVGKWQAMGGSEWTEYFSDGSTIHRDGMASTSSSWKRLEDGRIKVDSTVLGSSTSEVYQVSLDGDIATFTDSAGNAKSYRRSSPGTPSKTDAVASGLAKTSGSEGGQAHAQNPDLDRAAQRRTVADIRNVGTAMFSWLTDQVGSGAAGQSQTEKFRPRGEMGKYVRISHSDLEKLLVPQYLRSIPERDGWGHPYEFSLNTKNVTARQVMSIRSPGRDGRFESESYSNEGFDPDHFDEDIVWVDGFFVRWPQR